MKWLRWMLPLVLLLMFAMPVMASDSSPPGDLVIEQAMTDPLTPVPVLEAQDSLLTPLLAGFSGSSLISADEPQHQAGTSANIYANMQIRPPVLSLMRPTINAVQPVALRLWRTEGGVVLYYCTSPGLHQHSVQA